jgi:hypothetical protein
MSEVPLYRPSVASVHVGLEINEVSNAHQEFRRGYPPRRLALAATARLLYLYRVTSFIKSTPPPLGPYCRSMPRVLGGSYGGGRFAMSKVNL